MPEPSHKMRKNKETTIVVQPQWVRISMVVSMKARRAGKQSALTQKSKSAYWTRGFRVGPDEKDTGRFWCEQVSF
jgi:hypothetical protein